MLTFFVKWVPPFKDEPGCFVWKCYAHNQTEMFRHCYVLDGRRAPTKLRNCINHINSIGKQLRSYTIHITKEANEQRKKLGEPLYGCYCATERNKERIR